MNCICENKKPLKRELVTKKYIEGGLENVTLVNVERFHCPECGEEFFGYGNLEALHEKIAALFLQKKALLTGKEIRFIRKHLGYSGIKFAELVGYEPETVYRIEGGKNPVTPAFDRLIRFFAASKITDRNYDLHDLLASGKLRDFESIKLRHARSGEWKLLDDAA